MALNTIRLVKKFPAKRGEEALRARKPDEAYKAAVRILSKTSVVTKRSDARFGVQAKKPG